MSATATHAPELVELKHRLHRRLIQRINLDRLSQVDAPRVRNEVRTAVAQLIADENFSFQNGDRDAVIEQVLNEVFGLGPLEPLMQDPTISDILSGGSGGGPESGTIYGQSYRAV